MNIKKHSLLVACTVTALLSVNNNYAMHQEGEPWSAGYTEEHHEHQQHDLRLDPTTLQETIHKLTAEAKKTEEKAAEKIKNLKTKITEKRDLLNESAQMQEQLRKALEKKDADRKAALEKQKKEHKEEVSQLGIEHQKVLEQHATFKANLLTPHKLSDQSMKQLVDNTDWNKSIQNAGALGALLGATWGGISAGTLLVCCKMAHADTKVVGGSVATGTILGGYAGWKMGQWLVRPRTIAPVEIEFQRDGETGLITSCAVRTEAKTK